MNTRILAQDLQHPISTRLRLLPSSRSRHFRLLLLDRERRDLLSSEQSAISSLGKGGNRLTNRLDNQARKAKSAQKRKTQRRATAYPSRADCRSSGERVAILLESSRMSLMICETQAGSQFLQLNKESKLGRRLRLTFSDPFPVILASKALTSTPCMIADVLATPTTCPADLKSHRAPVKAGTVALSVAARRAIKEELSM
jgi:hypothetical protein